MDMIRGDHIVKNLEPESFFGLKKPFDPVAPIPCKFEQEFLFVAPVSDVPDMVGKKISVHSWHKEPLAACALRWMISRAKT